MQFNDFYLRLKVKWLMVFISMSACVDRIEFDVPEPNLLLVIEGSINDQPGPYTVKISQGLRLDSDSSTHAPVSGAEVTLLDDEGNEETFIESSSGTYKTVGIIQGQTGHSYFIRVVMPDGVIYESDPDKLNPVGEIQQIRYSFESRTATMEWGDVDASVFNVFIDSDAGPDSEPYVRWRYTGTYRVETFPELHMTHTPPYTPYKNPRPCSGYIVVPGPVFSGGLIEKIGDCTCCTCWVSDYERLPQLSDTQLITNNQFSNIKVGEVLLTRAAFHDKYLIEVEQMSLSRSAFDFFKLIRSQKENASNLFQPPSGEIIGNIRAINGNKAVVGIFWATAISKKSIFIYKTDLPYPIPPNEIIWDSCYDSYPNATNQKHPLWE
jgi:hypothetical protein